jgi:hypothetical protein
MPAVGGARPWGPASVSAVAPVRGEYEDSEEENCYRKGIGL